MQGKTKKDFHNILSFLASPSHPQPISLLIISLTYGKGEGEALYQIVQNKYQKAVKKKNKGKKKPPLSSYRPVQHHLTQMLERHSSPFLILSYVTDPRCPPATINKEQQDSLGFACFLSFDVKKVEPESENSGCKL